MVGNTARLRTIQFSEFHLWDVKRFSYIFNDGFENAAFLSEILKPYKVTLPKSELIENDWRIIAKINFHGKLFLRAREEIKSYKGQLSKVPDNAIIYSKINVRHGCVYFHEKDAQPFGVSNEYPIFTFDEKRINGQFLKHVLRGEAFKKLLNSKTSGISKARVKVDEFLGISIPLPSLAEQNRMVAAYNANIALAERQEEQAVQLEQGIDDYLFEMLGIKQLENNHKMHGLQFVNYQETSRWDTTFLISIITTLKSDYPIKKFSEVISYFNHGENGKTIRLDSIKYPEDDFYYIGMEHIEKETGQLLDLKSVKGREIKSQTLRVPENYLLYGKLRPYLNKYWLNETNHENIICSSEFFVFDVKQNINKQFFKSVLASSFIQHQITDKTSGARMPRINEYIFLNLQFPLPPLAKQQEIAQHITNIKTQIKALKNQAEQNRAQAIKAFEQAIFN